MNPILGSSLEIIYRLINTLEKYLPLQVKKKFRVFKTKKQFAQTV